MPKHELDYFVSDGLSNGLCWATYWRAHNGILKRVVSRALPLRLTKAEAERDLARWLERKHKKSCSSEAQ